MARDHVGVPDHVYDYLTRVGVREPGILARLREETRRHPRGAMQVPREEGAFLALLAELVGARRYLEIGTFTGYSSLAVALALPPDGRLVCCDISEEFTSIAEALDVTAKTVEGAIGIILAKLGLEEDARDNRRVLAVLAYLDGDPRRWL